MSVPLLNAEAAPEGAALWLQMIPEQNPRHTPHWPQAGLTGA
jgi:hypothetical protein